MITRVVPSIKGQSDPCAYESIGFQGRLRPPEDILRQARATSVTGVLGQIACVASYALEILQELKDETIEVQDRMAKLHRRVDVLAEVVDAQIHQGGGRRLDLLHLLPSQEESDHVLCVQTVSNPSYSAANDRPTPVVEAHNRCESVPPLELLDSFYDSENQLDNSVGSGPHTGSISRKKYSNPGFFMEEWLKNEKERQQRALEIKEERRRERRDAHHLRKARELDQQRQTTSSEDTKSSTFTSTEDTEQKLKFLKIRSWREIYGTGEGKELMKHQSRSPTLRDLRRKAHQGLASITHNPRTEERQQQPIPPPPPPQEEPPHTSHQSLTNEQFVTTPPDSPSIPTTLGGAFMQEMDDDEIAMEMQLEGEFANGIPPPPPPLPDSTSAEEFTDHGLSYYYDPATHNLVPPPPPPPEHDEQSKSDAYYDTYEEEDDDVPPPPPMEEFERSPPPPPLEPPRTSNLLEEIRLGTSLRSAKDRKPHGEAPVRPLTPQGALLHQIMQKQSRHLRHVEPRTRPPIQTRQPTGAPFSDSISRILERRTVIAYESDSSSSNEGDDDW
ncbi:hypothetical protein F441_11560 [Phytophthora nicotianae CJ01A1]|uniref:Wiskott-Aldrich syndrome protein family member n=2 Tax=Phytophthora nicotianae TaxID=4792 RepID=W2GKF8_PHYNI|nr:hypothetical protein L915_11320 [Phytophthora nicotianae]ETL36877.1 hypothetical protein L916_11222 [Phytophthora nicotianae]ETP13188.1 hypothetical protein F441_11560 [Phytophthora nicotianae CJ01A1]